MKIIFANYATNRTTPILDAIRIYLAIAETSSLSEVARQENIAVSSVSRKLDTLEADLGFKLFNRSSRRMMLTDAGEQFLQRAKNILLELDEAKHDMSALSYDPKSLQARMTFPF